MLSNRKPDSPISFHFWLLAAFLVFVFLTGGASRNDVQSLAILTPASVVLCGFAMLTFKKEHLSGRRWLLIGFVAICLLPLLHLVPLNSEFKHMPLSNYRFEDLTGLRLTPQPLAIAPAKALQSLTSLATPAAVLLIAMQLTRDDLYRTLPLLIGLIALSGFLGLLQAIGNPDSALYFYRLTNNGTAVGLFANRNHAALLLTLLFPLLAVFASADTGIGGAPKRRQLAAAAIAVVLVPLILVTGSRSGLLVALIGIAGAVLIYRPSPAERGKRGKKTRLTLNPTLIMAAALACLGFLTIFFSRAEAIDRLFAETSQYGRSDFWIASVSVFWQYFPWGSGAGSFAEVYQAAEPREMLGYYYLNRAHNDWIETTVTYGIPGVLLMTAGVALYATQTIKIWRMNSSRRVRFARMAGIATLMIGGASISDYPLRTPTMMCVLVILTLWFAGARREISRSDPVGQHLTEPTRRR